MGVVDTSSFARSLVPAMPNWFGLGYAEYEPIFKRFFKVKSSNAAIEEDALMSGMGLFRTVPQGSPTPYDSMQQVRTTQYSHTDYRLGIIITANAIADLKAPALAQARMTAMGRSWRETQNVICHNVVNLATSNTQLGSDGVCLASTSHPTAAGNQSNILSTAAPLSESTLEQMCINIALFTDEKGIRCNARAKTLIIPTALEFEAERILKSTGRVGTADNDLNALRETGQFPGGVIVTPYITDTAHFGIITTEDEYGLTMYVRKELELTDDTHFDTDNAKFKGHARFSVGFTDFRGYYDNGL